MRPQTVLAVVVLLHVLLSVPVAQGSSPDQGAQEELSCLDRLWETRSTGKVLALCRAPGHQWIESHGSEAACVRAALKDVDDEVRYLRGVADRSDPPPPRQLSGMLVAQQALQVYLQRCVGP